MGDNFHKELSGFVKKRDNENASRVILNELAKALVKDRENFIEVLRSADLSVLNDATDVQLVDSFVKYAPNNKKLLLGASYLVNHRNQTIGFDGDSEVSDAGVKTTYKELDEFFNGEAYSNAGWSDAIKSVADVGGGIIKSQDAKKRGASSLLASQSTARKEMINSILAQKQKEASEKESQKGKNKRTIIIASVIGGALLLGIGIYFMVRKKK